MTSIPRWKTLVQRKSSFGQKKNSRVTSRALQKVATSESGFNGERGCEVNRMATAAVPSGDYLVLSKFTLTVHDGLNFSGAPIIHTILICLPTFLDNSVITTLFNPSEKASRVTDPPWHVIAFPR